MNKEGPVVLVVLDGWGLEEAHEHNGVHLAQTPTFDSLVQNYPYTELHASGEHVGLPEGQMGNSEVGHTTIGAGTILYQDLVRISKDAQNGDFITNPAMVEAFDHVKSYGSQLHIMGLLSSGGVHAHEEHLMEVAHAAVENGVERIILHPFLDGRDAPPTAGKASLEKLQYEIGAIGKCRIATIAGRYYAMDRDKNWDRTDKAFRAIFHGEAKYYLEETDSIADAIQRFYDEGLSDEHIEPIVIMWEKKYDDDPKERGPLIEYKAQPNDAVIFTNFRTDRTRQLSQRICEKIEEYNLCFVTMTNYGNEINSIIAYEPQTIENTLASVIANTGLTQAHLAETDKYAHATYFLNGGRYKPHDKEEHVLVPSRKDVKTHDEAPEMKAKELTDEAMARLDKTDFIFINYANPDMVGHTANRDAIITAVETVDHELKRLIDATLEQNGTLLIIADHGNAERIADPETGAPHTAHTTNLVPCILVGKESSRLREKHTDPGLKDIAPTILDLLGQNKPDSMTGESLLIKKAEG